MEWAVFHGSAEDLGDHFKLTAAGGNGAISLPKDAVSFEHHKISIKIGTMATVLQEAQAPGEVASYDPQKGCEPKHHIGMVEFSNDGRVLGPYRVLVHA
jgi:hypothetical protein